MTRQISAAILCIRFNIHLSSFALLYADRQVEEPDDEIGATVLHHYDGTYILGYDDDRFSLI